MSAPTRFLAVAVVGWVTLRAAAGAMILPEWAEAAEAPSPAVEAAPAPRAASEPPISYAPLPGAAQVYPAGYAPAYAYPPGYGPGQPFVQAYPAAAFNYPAPRFAGRSYPVAVAPAVYLPSQQSAAVPIDFSGMPGTDEFPMSRPALAAFPGPGRGPAVTTRTPLAGPPRLDRWTLSTWALMRQEQASATAATNPALAVGGQLGGSQAGARLTYRPSPRLGVGLRFSGPIPAPGSTQQKVRGEAALGVSWQPLASLPVRVMAELRQRVGGAGGGRNAFALLAEGGVYGQSLPLGFKLNGYGQTGVVSLRSRDWFVDGGVTASRPLLGRYTVGLGAWGGAQQGLSRLDVGPRVSMRLLPGINAHVDYRWQALGNASPGSGYALTVAGDF